MITTITMLIAGALVGAPAPESDPLGKQLTERHQASFADGGMARWQEAMTPEMAHRFLAEKLAGEWKLTAQMNMGQGFGPEVSWTASAREILGGRYVESRAQGAAMGMSMDSLTVVGYDTVRRLFHATIFDSIGTGVKTLWGNLDKTGTVLTLVGEMDEPMSGEIGKSFLVAYTFHDDGSHTYEVKEILYGEPFTVIRARAERAGGG